MRAQWRDAGEDAAIGWSGCRSHLALPGIGMPGMSGITGSEKADSAGTFFAGGGVQL